MLYSITYLTNHDDRSLYHSIYIYWDRKIKVLYISFDRFLLYAESCDLSKNWQNPYNRVFIGQTEFFSRHFFLKKTFAHSGSNFPQNESSQSSWIYLSPEKLFQLYKTSNSWMMKFTFITKKKYLALGNLAKFVFWSILSFKSLQLSCSQFFWWVDSFYKKFRPQLLRNRKRSFANRHSSHDFCPWPAKRENKFTTT